MKKWKSVVAVCLAVLFVCGVVFADTKEDAQNIIKESGISGGLVVHVDCPSEKLLSDLKVSESFVVHGIYTDSKKLKEARKYIGSLSHNGTISASLFNGKNLPYIDNMVNLLVVADGSKIEKEEIMRVLTPRGVALVGKQKIVKPWPENMDEWNHYLHDADNNAVSKDSIIKPPISHLQWRGSPQFSRHHDKTATSLPALVSAKGKIFYIMDNGPTASIMWPARFQLIARDAFNGVVLWKKEIKQWNDHLSYGVKSGPAVSPRRLVAIGDSVYATLGLFAPVSKFDANTGKVLKVYKGTEKTEEIVVKDGKIYLAINPTVSEQSSGKMLEMNPKIVMAVNEEDGEILWQNKLSWIAPGTLGLGDDNVYLCNGPKILAFNKKTGKELWKSEDLPWRKELPTYFMPTLVTVPGGVLYVGGENWREHAGSKGMLNFLDADTGKVKWQQPHLPSGYQSPQDIFVIDGKAWGGSLNSKPGEFDKKYPEVSPSTGEFWGYDVGTGKNKEVIPGNNDSYWFHHRCHRARATENYFFTSRTGIEIIDKATGKWTLHHWIRGACVYGIMPANGLIYAPPHPCACYPEAKQSGFSAVSGPRDQKAVVGGQRLVKGSAYGKASGSHSSKDWPTYRGNSARDGSTAVSVKTDLKKDWELKLDGELSQPVVADGKVFVSAIDQHSVIAINQKSGKVAWKYVVGARVDSSPTYYKGLIIFGSSDGYVYCLRADDGELAWQFRAAPYDQRHMVYEQLESVWPVHGSVLIRDDVAYFTAGRSMFLEGGMSLFRLNPVTGEMLSEEKMTSKDPLDGGELTDHIGVLSMPVGSSDILSSEGKYVFMRSQLFDLAGKRTRIKQVDLLAQEGRHLFAGNGFLDDSFWHRSFWQYGTGVKGGPGYGGSGSGSPAGKIMVLDKDNLYIFGRKENLWRWTVPTEYSLTSVERSVPAKPQPPKPAKGEKRRRIPGVKYQRKWELDMPIMVRAIVKAGDIVFAAGPKDIVDEFQALKLVSKGPEGSRDDLKEQSELFAGKDGSVLVAVSSGDGKKISETKLDVLPVFDGMIAAGGKLYMSTVDSKVVCLGSK